MKEQEMPQLSLVECLPFEIRHIILTAIPDLFSLRSTALSCPAFYHVFTTAETTITTSVLFNQFDSNVLTEAITALEISKLQLLHHEVRDTISTFALEWLCKRQIPPESWTLKDALILARLHTCVTSKAQEFAASALNKAYVGRRVKSLSPSQSEICRIQRALYWFEIFCNIHHQLGKIKYRNNVWEERDFRWFFFCNFAPWENEQLACIHDFLVRSVAPAFNQIVEKDTFWGVFPVEEYMLSSRFIQQLLSFGLERVCKISAAKTLETRRKFIYSGYCPQPISFLYDLLKAAANNHTDDRETALLDYTPDEERVYINSPFFNDPDKGPHDAWWWAHQNEACTNFVNQEDRAPLREWGYVMWDRSRLEELGYFDRP